jgi:hypothetical protein
MRQTPIATLHSTLAAVFLSGVALAQPGASARVAPALDMTGHWVSVVTEDWAYRMVTPEPGVFAGIPVNDAARSTAEAWAPGESDGCLLYGAANLMNVPGRLRIGWQDDATLRIETDAGRQTRLLHFDGTPTDTASSLQGYSEAEWRYPVGEAPADATPNGGSLEVVTTRLSGGYLRGNGIPYGRNATLTEYFNVFGAPNGDEWLVVTSIVEDPDYLTRPYYTSRHFKKVEGSGWNPTDCS